ncbi:MAG: branched-chain amino acid ABC transporter permease [Acidimicrobiales bacterium]
MSPAVGGGGAVAFVLVPVVVGDFWLSVLTYAGIFAIAALGLSLLTGYAGQVSVGHAFFMGVGAYVGVYFGAGRGLPLPVWLVLAGLAGAAAGAVVAPAALRLSGLYLAMVTVGLLFVGVHVWNNFESVTGGAAGIAGEAPARLGPLDFNDLRLAGQTYSRNQSWFWLVWALAAVAAVLVRNVTRSRVGRAMQAVRDSPVGAAAVGIDVQRTKLAAFVSSSLLAAVAGGLYFAFVQYVSPEEWGLALSVNLLAMLIIGGMATWWGAIVGATVLGGAPRAVEELTARVPAVTSVGLSAAELNQLLLGVLIVIFVMFQPEGLVGAWVRARTRIETLRRRPSPPERLLR